MSQRWTTAIDPRRNLLTKCHNRSTKSSVAILRDWSGYRNYAVDIKLKLDLLRFVANLYIKSYN